MDWPRPSRILAVARQDLAHEFKGRQGLLLPAVLTGLMVPVSTVSSPLPEAADPLKDLRVSVHGDVPPGVTDAADVVPFHEARIHLRFTQTEGGLLVDGPVIPSSVRAVLDGDDPAVTVFTRPRGYLLPGRTALLSLISASTLTGAVAQSIGGERSRRTLGVLLTAAVTRTEIVLGKWAAWGGFGAAASLVAAAVAVVVGRTAPGAWIVALPTVPLATVALGLWLVRRAGDVMAGSATALRVLPAALSILGIVAWLLGDTSPWLGAAVPLGGALLAAGATWPHTGATLLAAVVTLGFAGVMLVGTIRDLEEVPDRTPTEDPWVLTVAVTGLAACAWWLPIAGPELWSAAGNPKITQALVPTTGIAAGGLALLLMSIATVFRSTLPIRQALGVAPAGLGRTLTGALGGLVLLAIVLGWPLLPALGDGPIRYRFFASLAAPGLAGALAALGDELLFRGWLQRRAGAWRSLAAFVLVKAPLDPVGGVLFGGVGTLLSAWTGSAIPALAARLAVWALVSVWMSAR